MVYTDEQVRAWISRTLPGENADALASTPIETLYALYGDICKYGPNGANFVEAQKDLAMALKQVSPNTRLMHEITSSAMMTAFGNPAPRNKNDEVDKIADTIASNWDSQHYFLIFMWLDFIVSDGFREEDEIIADTVTRMYPLFCKASKVFDLDPQKYRWVEPV